MSYQKEREQCIAELTRHGLPYHVIAALLRCATTINRLAELACSSEAADRDRIKCPRGRLNSINPTARQLEQYPCLCDMSAGDTGHNRIPRITLQDYQAEQRAIKAVPAGWHVLTSGDPRGYTLHVVPPAYAAENEGRERYNWRSIGVPPGPSGLRW